MSILFVHRRCCPCDHQGVQYKKVHRKERRGNILGDQAEERRREQHADVGGGHLGADDCLGEVFSEKLRCQVEHIRENGTVAQADEKQADAAEGEGQRKKQGDDGRQKDHLPDFDQLPAVEESGQHTGEKTAKGKADIIESDHPGRGIRRGPFCVHEEGAAPGAAGVFQSAVADKYQAGHAYLWHFHQGRET